MAAQVADPDPSLSSAKTLICALNFLSRNLPLPQHIYDAVSSIYDAPQFPAHGIHPADATNDPLPKVCGFLSGPFFSALILGFHS